MKKVSSITVFMVLLVIPFLFIKCTDQLMEAEDCDGDAILAMNPLPPVLDDFSIAGVHLPSKTMTEYVTPRIVNLTFPKGYKWVSVNSDGAYTMSGSSTYSCSCTGTGCNVMAMPPTKKGGKWDIGSSSCTDDCTGKWVDSDVGVNSGFINIDKGISFIHDGLVECGSNPNPTSFFEIPELQQKIDEFLSTHKLSLWNGTSDDFVLIPLNMFGTPVVLKFDSDLPTKLLTDYENKKTMILTSDDDIPTCGCASGSSGCEYEPITYRAGLFGERTVGHSCIAGDCVTCNMTLPEVN